MRRLRSEAGQSSVELVALLPLVLAVALGVFAFLSAGAAREAAASAAQAAALALLQDGDADEAARDVLERAAAGSAVIRVHGRDVSVRVRPRGLGPLADLLTARSTADAGTGASTGPRSTTVVRGGDGQGSR